MPSHFAALRRAAVFFSAAFVLMAIPLAAPAHAGATTGTWRNYPNGIYAPPRQAYGYRPGYGNGYGAPAYGYGRPAYGYGGRGYGYQGRRDRTGEALAAGVLGLAAGAVIGGALSQGRASSCAQYRTYDPRSGTYVGRGGVRQACR